MQPIHVTQCPKCDTTFRVTQAQLTAAKGAVRCGACLHVFRAAEHFQTQTPTPTAVPDDRTQDLFAEKASSDRLFASAHDKRALADKFVDSRVISDDMDDDNRLINDDSEFIDDDLVEVDAFQKKPPSFDLNEEFLSLRVQDDSDPFTNDKDRIIDDEERDFDEDESWAQALIDDSDEVTAPIRPQSQPPISKPLIKPKARPVFSYIEDVPLDLSLPVKASKRKKTAVFISCLILLTVLAAQTAYFNFDQWARIEPYRAYYQLTCEVIKCQLPSTYDLNKIRTTASPQVSLHSKFENALIVDVLFINNAEYEQAFPRLEIGRAHV